MSEEIEYANIPVRSKTKERLDKIASKDKTYDDFINDLLDIYEKGAKK